MNLENVDHSGIHKENQRGFPDRSTYTNRASLVLKSPREGISQDEASIDSENSND
jgi:hypothetical protein